MFRYSPNTCHANTQTFIVPPFCGSYLASLVLPGKRFDKYPLLPEERSYGDTLLWEDMQVLPTESTLQGLVDALTTHPLLLAIAITCGTFILYSAIRSYQEYRADTEFGKRHGCLPPPQLPNHWPLGVDRLKELWESNSKGHLLAFLCSLADGYEPRNNLSQYMLFGPRVFHTLHPKNVECLLSSNFQDFGFGLRRDIFHPLLGDGIFTQEGPDWKHSRKLLQKQFARAQYQDSDHFREHVDNLFARLHAQSGVVDLQPLFFRLTLDTTTALLFGQSVYSLRSHDVAGADEVAFAESFNTAQEGLAKRFRIAPWHFFYNPSSFKHACSNVHRFVDDYIESRLQQKPALEKSTEPPGFFEEVARESTNNTTLRDQLINVLLAGRDTAACCMSWTLRLLVRHPPVMQLLREEIRSVIGSNRHPRREQLQQMPYLRKVIRESLRLYPPVPLNNRTALRTTMLPTGGGSTGSSPILVRRGEVVIYSSYVNSRRRNIWGADADVFVPERWDRPELGAIGWAYFPFSGGPRVCLGQDFALMEVSYTVVRLLQAFGNISLPPSEEIEPLGTERQRLTLVLSSADGCRVQLGESTDASNMTE